MIRKSLIVALLFAGAVALPAAAQTREAVVAKGPGVAGAAQTVEVTATITKIDAKNRVVTLKGPRGGMLDVNAGPEVKNFNQLKVGDQVDVQYAEALMLELKKGGGQTVARTEREVTKGAKPGETPAGAKGREVKVVGDVIATDPATQMVTVKGPNHTVDFRVDDPAQFKNINKGDQVEATYVQAIAMAVQKKK